jgi:ATP-dependent Clp protease adaptor protein ClpS
MITIQNATKTKTKPKVDVVTDVDLDKGWRVLVWNDHVNLMSYVSYVFKKVLGFNDVKAKKHMMEVHEQGKSCVAVENREKAELFWQQLQQYGLRTSLEKAE